MTATVSESKRGRVGLRILVVDDNVDAADTLARLLQAWGHEACAVYSGADALGVLATVQPEVIFSDLAMPTMDGMAFAKAIRQISFSVRSLIALTGYADSVHRTAALLDAGFDDFLTKPTDPQKVKALLASVESAKGGQQPPSRPRCA
jgi:CheY-like chemotaxis protein